MQLIKVIANTDGFRRAGRAWPKESIVDMEALPADVREAIEQEPKIAFKPVTKEEASAWAEANQVNESSRPEDEAEAKKQIADAITAIGGDKKPTVKAVNEKLEGWEATGKEIAAVWDESFKK
tara:strand:+ start:123 stop:491 length:369 start_codon:yes stop_codon:yes gene_type:complete